MTSRVRILLLCGAFVVLPLAACSGDDDPSPEEKFIDSYAEKFCAHADICCKQAGQAHSPQACREFIGFFGYLSQSAKFDAAAAAECLAQLDAQRGQCEQGEPDACDRVFSGSTPKGGKCSSSNDCAAVAGGDVTCHYESSGGSGRCVIDYEPAPGKPCGEYVDDERYDCSYSTDFTCESNVCVPKPKLGEPCVFECSAGAYCDSGANPSICKAIKALGEDCSGTSSSACGSTAYCAAGKCAMKGANGAPCSSGSECVGYCDNGLCAGTGGTLCVTNN